MSTDLFSISSKIYSDSSAWRQLQETRQSLTRSSWARCLFLGVRSLRGWLVAWSTVTTSRYTKSAIPNIDSSSFKAGNSQIMLNYKLEVRKRLKCFNDDSFPDGCTLDSLKYQRMAVAKLMFGKLEPGTNIEAPLFCTWGCNTFIGENVYMNRKWVSKFLYFFVSLVILYAARCWSILQCIHLRQCSSLDWEPSSYRSGCVHMHWYSWRWICR